MAYFRARIIPIVKWALMDEVLAQDASVMRYFELFFGGTLEWTLALSGLSEQLF
jgi:hypothetical protein